MRSPSQKRNGSSMVWVEWVWAGLGGVVCVSCGRVRVCEAGAFQERMFERVRLWVTVRPCRYQWACVCGVDGGGGGGDGEWVQV